MINRTMKNWKEKVQVWVHGGGHGQGWSTNKDGREAGSGSTYTGLLRYRRGHLLLLRKPREVEEGDKVDRLSRDGRDN